MEVVRLGQGVDRTGRHRPGGARRAPSTPPAGTATSARSWASRRIRFVATSASRDAENRRRTSSTACARRSASSPRSSAGEEEAALSFRGATGVLGGRHPGPFLVVDLGGGSTELVLGTTTPEAAVLDGRRLRADDRAAPAQRPADRRRDRGRAAPTSPRRSTRAAAVVPLGETVTLVGLAGIGHHGDRARAGPARLRPARHRRRPCCRSTWCSRRATTCWRGRARTRAALRLHAPGPGRRDRRRCAGVADVVARVRDEVAAAGGELTDGGHLASTTSSTASPGASPPADPRADVRATCP